MLRNDHLVQSMRCELRGIQLMSLAVEFKRMHPPPRGNLSCDRMRHTPATGAGFKTYCPGPDLEFREDEGGVGGVDDLGPMREGEGP